MPEMTKWLLMVVTACICRIANSSTIDIPKCPPPDYPEWGGYGPRQDSYSPGDVIHYYCDVDAYIGGNYYRRCEDTGDWTGDTPVCDTPAQFSMVNQTNTADPDDDNGADLATDFERNTCSGTRSGEGSYWMGILTRPGQLIRVMLFLPKVNIAYEVFMIKQNGQEFSCGKKVGFVEHLNWEFHNCPEPHNTDVVAIKIKSLSSYPLQLCEVVAHTLTFPTCVDPHVPIENGRLELSRKRASLVCDSGFSRSPNTRLQCIRTGVWNRKTLYCQAEAWEVEAAKPSSDLDP